MAWITSVPFDTGKELSSALKVKDNSSQFMNPVFHGTPLLSRK